MDKQQGRLYLTHNRLIAVLDELERSREALDTSLLNAKPPVRVSLKYRIARIDDLLLTFGQMLEEKGETQ